MSNTAAVTNLSNSIETTTIASVIIIGIIIYYIVAIAFSLTIYRLVKQIDEADRKFPAWYAWMFLIPIVGYVFQWILLPFGIGSVLKRHENFEVQRRANTLFTLALALVILPVISWISYISQIASIATFVIFILYWVKASKMKRLLSLLNEHNHTTKDI